MPGTRTRRSTGHRNTGSQSTRQDTIYSKITDRMITQLREGTVPWRKKWSAIGGAVAWPVNIKSKKPYRGINPIVLATEPYTSPWWGSYGQWALACGAVKNGKVWQNPDGTRWAGLAGQHGTTIIFWKQIFVDTDEISPRTHRPVKKRIPMLHSYVVFNYEQVTGAPERFAPAEAAEAPTRVQQMLRALEIHKAYIERAGLTFTEGGDRAFYDLHNTVRVPALAAYEDGDEAEYWSTVFHEDAHSTGHKSRVNRPGIENFDHFGSGQYSKEELAAEMSAAMLMAVAGIETPATFTNSAAYIANWLSKLDSDPKLVIQAAAQAQRAVDYILGVTFADDDDDDEED
jgi:antirestriction protein ArdC